MLLTGKHMSRRTALRGLGVSLALPLLDSMVPARTVFASTAERTPAVLCIAYPSVNVGTYYVDGVEF